MRKLVLSVLAAGALLTASSSAFAGYWTPGPYGPVYVPTYNCVPTLYGPVCGMN